MDLQHSGEPLRQIAVVVTAVLVAVGAALTSLAGTLDWGWIAPASTAVAAVVGILSHWVGTETGRTSVTPQPHVEQAKADAVAQYAVDQAPAADTTPDDDADALDTAMAASGLA